MKMKDKLKEALSKSVPKKGIGKALAEKKFKLKINKNLDMDIKLDKDEKKIGFSYKKRF
jgi:hypothetical protein